MRAITVEDIIKLTELPFMRISRYDRDKARSPKFLALEGKMEQGNILGESYCLCYRLFYQHSEKIRKRQKNVNRT